jgi:hypothetical protein
VDVRAAVIAGIAHLAAAEPVPPFVRVAAGQRVLFDAAHRLAVQIVVIGHRAVAAVVDAHRQQLPAAVVPVIAPVVAAVVGRLGLVLDLLQNRAVIPPVPVEGFGIAGIFRSETRNIRSKRAYFGETEPECASLAMGRTTRKSLSSRSS